MTKANLPRDKMGRFFKGGTAYPNGRPECVVPGCHAPFRSGSGYCVKHISQIRFYGKVLEHTKFDPRQAIIEGNIAKIPLNINAKDGYAIVDKEFAWLDQWKWHLNQKSGYANA